MKQLIKKLLRESLIKEEQYFTPTISNNIKKRSNKFSGRYVDWYGDPETMIYIDKDFVDGMFGNVYDSDKMEYLTDLIKNHDDNVEIETSYGHGDVVTIRDVIEQQEAYRNGRFSVDYDGIKEPKTTDDDEIDDYLSVEDLEDAEIIYTYPDTDGVYEYANANQLFMINGKTSSDFLNNMYTKLDINKEDLTEDDLEFLKEFFEAEQRVLDIVKNEEGDIGTFRVQLRDGHHRVNSAINAGEKYVALDLGDDGVNTYKEYIDKLPYVGRVINKG